MRHSIATLLLSLAAVAALAQAPTKTANKAEFDRNFREQTAAIYREKASRSPAMRRMSQDLIFAIRQSKGENLRLGVPKLKFPDLVRKDGTIEVEFGATVSDLLLARLQGFGAKIETAHARFHSIAARMPVRALESAAMLPGVRWVSSVGGYMTNAGTVQSEGDASMGSNVLRSYYGLTGAKQKIGILSDSNDFQEGSQASGELPALIDVPYGNDGRPNTGEGTAMMEIVHDVAPGADIGFSTADPTEADFASHMLDLYLAGCGFIADDVQYYREPAFQDGIIAATIDTMSRDGVLSFSSAGNSGAMAAGTGSVWEGDFSDSGGVIVYSGGITASLHGWSNGTAANAITLAGAKTPNLSLQWNDPWGNATSDYDLFLADPNGNILEYSADNNIGGNPIEEIKDSGTTGNLVFVAKLSGQNRVLRMCQARGRLQFATNGQIYGHAAADNDVSVGAIKAARSPQRAFNAGDNTEPFSSDGPSRMYYEFDGTPLTSDFSFAGGVVRSTPTLSGPDGVLTSIPNFAPFFGTSAAAPHVAALAALLQEFAPDAKPSQIRTALVAGTIDIGLAGIDDSSGHGAVSGLGSIKILEEGKTLGIAQLAPKMTDKPITLTLDLGRKAPPKGIYVQVTAYGATSYIDYPSGFLIPGGTQKRSFTVSPGLDGVGQATLTLTDVYSTAYLGTATIKRVPHEKVVSVSLSPKEVRGGVANSVCTVKLNAPATGDYALEIQSSNPALASVPSQIAVAKGQQTFTFPVPTNTPSDQVPVNIEARIAGIDAPWTFGTLLVDPPAVSSITPDPSSLYEGDTCHFLLTLDGPAPAGGVVYSMQSSDPSLFYVPSTVTFAAGETSHTVSVKAMAAPFLKDVKITVTKHGVEYAHCTVHIVAPEVASVSLSPASVKGGNSVQGTVTLNHVAGIGGRGVMLSVTGSGVSVPMWFTVPQGATSATFTVSTQPTDRRYAVRVTAKTFTITKYATLVVTHS